MQQNNQSVVDTFYQAFQKRDGQIMATCYHPEAAFQDEVFTLEGGEIGKMWQMLCERAKHFSLSFEITSVSDNHYKVQWIADYEFSKTGRMVKNVIEADIELKDGLIYRHRDRFDFWRWSRQALGMPGIVLGWSSWLRRQVAQQANSQLQRYQAK